MNQNPSRTPEGVHLIPVLEVQPDAIVRHGRGRTALGGDRERLLLDVPEEGVTIRLFPLAEGWYQVPIAQFVHPRALELVVQTRAIDHLDDPDDWAADVAIDPDDVTALDGGLVLCLDGKVAITPRCCSDLADISSWRGASEHRSPDKVWVWIGHPWVDVRFDGSTLVFTESEEQEESCEWRVDPDELADAVAQASQELEDFSQRLVPIVEPLVPAGRAIETARVLAGLEPGES